MAHLHDADAAALIADQVVADRFQHAPLAPELRGAVWSDLNFKYTNIYDVSAAERDLGLRYTITWEEGIRRILASYEKHGLLEGDGADPLYDRIIGAWERLTEALRREMAGS